MTTIEKLNKIIAKTDVKLKIDNSTLNKTTKELGIDSLSLVGIIVQIEEELKITLDDDKLSNLKTVKDLVDLIDATIKK